MYENYVDKLCSCEFGELRERDFIQGKNTDMASYRMATLEMKCESLEAGRWGAVFAALAVEVNGYMTMNTYGDGSVKFSVMITRNLEDTPCAAT